MRIHHSNAAPVTSLPKDSMPASSVSGAKYGAMENSHVIDANQGAPNLAVFMTIIASGSSPQKEFSMSFPRTYRTAALS